MKTSPVRFPRCISCDDEAAASEALGGDHDLVRALRLRRALVWQLAVTSVPVVFGIVGTARHIATAPLVLGAAGFVELMLIAGALFVRQQTRDRAHELIASEHAELGLSVVMNERRRLLSRKERERLARSLERLLQDAQNWGRILPTSRPPLGVRSLRYTAEEVRGVVALLRSDSVSARSVALVTRFITDGASSSLYQGDVEKLRAELDDILASARPRLETIHEERLAA